jgi:xanthine dehydrogenase accessory factor
MLAMLSSGEGDVTLLDYRLAVDLGMSCGGSVQILVEPIFGSSPVLVVGAGHVGLALASLLLRLGFSLTLADERPSALAPERLAVVPGARAKLGRASEVAAGLPRRAAVVVATHEHALDQDAVAWALREGFAFVGGVGSRGKAARIRKELLASGLPESALASLRMPVGVEIGARSPEEIALAIAAQLVAWRSEGGGGAAQAPAPTPAPQEEPCTAT